MYDSDDVIPTSDFAGQRPQADIPFTVRRRLNWGDSDTAEIGYTSKFIDFAIEAIEVWWEAVLGLNWYQLKRQGMGNPAVALQVDFLSPVVVGDRVDTAVEVERLGRSSITYRVAMTKVGGPKCFSGLLTTALVTRVHSENIKGHPFPDDWRRRIEGYRRECALRERGVKSKREVIDFWFGPPGSPERGQRREIWFAPQSGDGSDFDREIEANFLASHEAAAAGELDHWADTPDGVLALCILLDQFPRNMFRGTARAFATDAKILGIVKETVAAGLDRDVHHVPGIFLYLPFEHSEDLADQHRFRELIGRWADTPRGEDLEKYADGHREVIERFGRFPHRNAALRRTNTPEEEAYLSDPDAGF